MSGGPRNQTGFLPIVPEDLPEGWTTRVPDETDVDELIALVSSAKRAVDGSGACLLYTSPSPRDRQKSRMPSSA